MCENNVLIIFFFQAEDGIRDIGVTGVQTCALPILGGGALEPELLEAPGAGPAGVVADQLPALAAEPVEHRAGVTGLALRLPAGELDAHPSPLRLRVVGRDDRGVLPGGHGEPP